MRGATVQSRSLAKSPIACQFDVHQLQSIRISLLDPVTQHAKRTEPTPGLGPTERLSQQLTTAIEQVAEAVMITDTRGAILYVNPAFETTTGYTRAEVLGQNPRLLKSGLQDAAFYEKLWATLAGALTWRGRLVNRKKDGTIFTEEATISPVRDESGAVASYVAVKRDITAQLALEAQLLQAQRMEVVGRLAGGVAHDFNNLLTIILTYSAEAIEALPEGDPLRADLLEVKRAGERGATLTRQLLAFSRKQVVQPETIVVNEVLTEMDKMLRRLIGEDVTLELVCAPEPWAIHADRSQIEQVVMNLAVNARDAMPGGGTLRIAAANVELGGAPAGQSPALPPGAYVQLTVSDTGVGIDAPTLDRIFEPFFTTKGPGKGTGLGLSMVQGIVRQSLGEVEVTSEPGRGARFTLTFPRRIAAADSPAAVRPDTASPRRGAETILVVEDREELLRVVRRMLEMKGYTVLTAADGPEAVRVSAWHGDTIHLLLTDVVMPGGMLARDLAARLCAERPGLKVLFMSGYTDDAVLRQGISTLGTHFLNKPFTGTVLTAKVRAVLDAPQPRP